MASAQAAVRQAEVNLSHCMIYSPIDGVVVSRTSMRDRQSRRR